MQVSRLETFKKSLRQIANPHQIMNRKVPQHIVNPDQMLSKELPEPIVSSKPKSELMITKTTAKINILWFCVSIFVAFICAKLHNWALADLDKQWPLWQQLTRICFTAMPPRQGEITGQFQVMILVQLLLELCSRSLNYHFKLFLQHFYSPFVFNSWMFESKHFYINCTA